MQRKRCYAPVRAAPFAPRANGEVVRGRRRSERTATDPARTLPARGSLTQRLLGVVIILLTNYYNCNQLFSFSVVHDSRRPSLLHGMDQATQSKEGGEPF